MEELLERLGERKQQVERLKKEISNKDDKLHYLKIELTLLKESLYRKNCELDFLHYVWCDGGCSGGMHRYFPHLQDLTEEQVEMAAKEAERYARRLRTYYANREYRKEHYGE